MAAVIQTWISLAIQQMAAESYLQRVGLVGLSLGDVLKLGNNNDPSALPDDADLSGKTRFVDLAGVPNASLITGSAQAFVSRYQIIDHHANDATGFSATLMRDTVTGQYTLSFRSLEYQNQAQGGDWERDGQGGAAGEIAGAGFALGQLVSMERYYQELKNSGKLPVGATLNVTGYSLGGHLATVFTELHSNEINHTYIFNGAGIGQVGGITPVLTEDIRIKQLIDAMEAKFVEFDPLGNLTRSGSTANVQALTWYQPAVIQVAGQFQTTGTASMPTGGLNGGITRTDGAFQKITQLFGASVTGGDVQLVANSGMHGPVQSVLIEGQPLVEGLPDPFRDYGHAHSITLLVDSLALQALFETLDPDLAQTDIENMLKASSSTRADVTAFAVEEHTAEGDTLERALDVLRALFVPNTTDATTDFNDDTGGFGNLGTRTEFYTHLAEVQAAVVNQTFSIEPLVQRGSQGNVVPRLTVAELVAEAQANTDQGLAYRYALRALNPFAVIGVDYVGLGHAADGQLALYDSVTGFGEMTERYLTDRAAFLLAKLDLTLNNQERPSDIFALAHYWDMASGFEVPSGLSIPVFSQREYLFGGEHSDTLTGHDLTNNQLYGSAGNDLLQGFGSDDYLQGDSGHDRLDGGTGDDTLHGGLGFDTYILSPDGTDRIDDGDGQGAIQLNGQLVVGGIRKPGDAADTYKSVDGQFTFVQSGGTLTINNHLTIQHWQPGVLGIMLRDLSSLSDETPPEINYVSGQPTVSYDGDATDNHPIFNAGANHIARGFGGNDVLDFEGGSLAFNHQIFGGDGHDELRGGSGQDRMYGEAGRDLIIAVEGDDVLDGGAEIDLLKGGIGQDALYGGLGNDGLDGGSDDDLLWGGEGDDVLSGESIQLGETTTGNDYLDGEAGDDWLLGLRGDDVLEGGDNNDRLYGDQAPSDVPNLVLTYPGLVTFAPHMGFLSQTGGKDYLDGGAGEDFLQGDAGDDVLLGGSENDTLYGDDQTLDGVEAGKDLLDGGAGDDLLNGGGEADTLIGGVGDDTLFGDFLNDPVGAGDWLDGGAGSDFIAGGRGDDTIFGGADNDTLLGNEGQDVLDGGRGNDELQGGSGADVLWGEVGNDHLVGDEGNDTLFGGDGGDTLNGSDGEDVLVGGAGTDTLIGGAGADTYIFNLGDGVESIQDAPGEGNKIVFGVGITAEEIGVGIGSLIIRVGFSGDAIHIQGFDPANPMAPVGVETFEFADGTTLTQADLIVRGFDLVGTAYHDSLNGGEIYRNLYGLDGNDFLTGGALDNVLYGGSGNDLLFGNGGLDQVSGGAGDDVMRGGEGNDGLNGEAGNDSLEGEAGDDMLVGGTGDDQLYGGEGDDTYRFNGGDGLDSLFDSGASTDMDTIVFGNGITSSMVSLTSQFGQIIIKVGAGSDGIQSGSSSDVFGSQTIERFQFADGTSITYADLVTRGITIDGTEFDDILLGTNLADRLHAGLGNDRMEGGAGNDSYFFNMGDGSDMIADTASVGAGNDIVFGPGIASTDLRLDLVPDQSAPSRTDLLLRVGTNGDAIQLDTFDRNNVLGSRTVDAFRFADGGTLTYEQVIAQGFDLTGTDGDDQIIGTNVADRIVADAGADFLRGGLGDDRLDGGAGKDRLYGGQGNDAYVFGPGSGQDTVTEFQGGLDWIQMVPGVSASEVVVTRNNNDLVFSLNGGADRLTVSLYFLAPPLQVELVQFADGTIWDQTVIANLVQPSTTGTEGPDVLEGTHTDDRLVGLAGDDQMTGLAGNDLLDGGTGADQLAGGAGNDTYIIDEAGDLVTELANEGTDTVLSAVSTQLTANVENLTLMGTSAINGTGNDLDNVLAGNSGVNILAGGAGNDTYIVDTGDTVVEQVEEGTDNVLADMSATLGANVENLTLTGSASLTGTGNNLDNVLKADGSISVLAGGDGNDTYVIGPNGGDDILVETATGGIDTVIAGHDYRLPANIEHLTLLDPRVPDFASFSLIPFGSSEQSVAGYGNNLANILIGRRANNVLDGGLGADTMIGGAGHDTYIVDNLSDIVIEQPNEGRDSVQSAVSYGLSEHVENLTLIGTASINGTGNARTNDMRGNEASNVLDGGAGDDELQGFGGADTYLFGRSSGRDTVFDSSVTGEIDTVRLAAALTPADIEVYRRDFGLVLVIAGTTDELTLASFFDQPEYAQKQVRFADGTVWDDTELRARAVTVGVLFAGTIENDVLAGSAGHDVLVGEAGDDVLSGGLGNDWLYGDATSQSWFGQQSIDNDSLFGGAGDDILIDFQGANLFDGGLGNDALFLGTGHDTILFGRGHGNDSVQFDKNGSDIDIVQMAGDLAPSDVILTRRIFDPSIIDLTIRDTGETLALNLSTDFFAIIDPTAAQVRVLFADGTQWNVAPVPADPSSASAGADLLNASFPATLAGLAGDDTYLLGSSGIHGAYAVIEESGEGIDTVQSLFDYVLDPMVENLILAESRSSVLQNPESGTGNDLDNLIIGNTGDNVLDGGGGNDVLVGGVFRSVAEFFVVGTGSDILIGGAGDDILMADGGNVVFAMNGADGSWLFLGGGSEFREAVPREADDLLIGGTGNDTYIVHSQQQTVAEFANEGTDTVKSTVSYTLGEHVENLVLVDPSGIFDGGDNVLAPRPLNGTGNDLDNLLLGSGSGNVLAGGGGDDTLWGGNAVDAESGVVASGNDTLIGGTGNDTYLFKRGDEIDTIQDVASVDAGNRIQFGEGITRNDLTLAHDEVSQTLTIQVGSSGTDKLVLTNFDPTNVTGSLVVETLAFADGTTTNLASLLGGPVNQVPTVASPLADRTVPEDAPFTIQVPADAFADQDSGDTLTYSASLANGNVLPTWLNFNGTTRTFTGTPDDAQVGSLDLRVTATDTGDLTASDIFTLTVTNVNDAPTVTVPLADQTALEDASFSLAMPAGTFADVDADDSLTYNATLTGGAALPTWLSFSTTTRTFAGTPLNSDVGTLNVMVTVTDLAGLSAADTFVLTVQNVNDAPTVLNGLADQSAAEDSVFVFTVPSTTFADEDVMHGDGLTYRATLTDGSPLPSWLNFSPMTRTFSGTPGAGDAGTLQLAVTATDSQTTSVVEEFTLTVSGPLPQTVVGTSGNDVLTGGRGDDTLAGGIGSDALSGGAGNDTYFFNLGDGVDTITDTSLQGESNVLQFGTGITLNDLSLGIGSLLLRVGNNGDAIHLTTFDPTDVLRLRTIETFRFADGSVLSYDQLVARGFDEIGTAGNDAISGTNMVDRMKGLAGNDLLIGGDGHDFLDGGVGTDVMQGGTGNDTYIVDMPGDGVTELANEGVDTVESSITYALGANVENLTLVGTAAINGTGNALNNVLMGNSANNTLNGGTGHDRLDGRLGSDVMSGGVGDDTYVVNQAGDVVTEQVGQGSDTVESSMTYFLGPNVEHLTLVGSGNINGTGNTANNVLLGNSGNNTLEAGSGDDTLDGGSGYDALFGGSGNDRLLGGFGDDYLSAGSGNDLLNGGQGGDVLDGGSGDDQLLGDTGNDQLIGGSGADQFTGGLGNDLLVGSSGNDTYNFSRGDGQDTILDVDPFLVNQDLALFGTTINPLDLVISRQANDLRLAIHGSTDQVTVKDWYLGRTNRIEMIQAGNGEILLSTQVNQLIQAMASFTQQSGLTWDQAIDQRPQDVQAVLAASWQ